MTTAGDHPQKADGDADGRGDGCDPIDDPCLDFDGDGFGGSFSAVCPHEGIDCDDDDPARNPGLVEIPGNAVGDDCDPDTPIPTSCNPEPQSALASVGSGLRARSGASVDLPLDLFVTWLTSRWARRRTARGGKTCR